MADHIESGPARVLSHGSATTFLGHPLSVSFELPDASWYRVDFRCVGGDGEPSITSQAHPWGIELDLRHFREGRGSAVPVLLGEVGPQLFFLHFRVFRYGDTIDHTVHWTAYVANKVDVDWRPTAP